MDRGVRRPPYNRHAELMHYLGGNGMTQSLLSYMWRGDRMPWYEKITDNDDVVHIFQSTLLLEISTYSRTPI